MELTISKTIRQFLAAFLLLILPALAILLGVIFEVYIAWYFILCVTWFGMGLIFYCAIE